MRDDELYSSGIFASELDDDLDAPAEEEKDPDEDDLDDDDEDLYDDEDEPINPLDDYKADEWV